MNDIPTRVLIVDDDKEDYLIACDLLRDVQHHRYATTWAGDVETGLREIETGNYDACLLDYRIGSSTGLDFLRELSSRKTSKTPVIMLTGSANREVDLEAMQHGVSDFIVKGALTAAALERTIRYCIERAATLADLAKKNEELARLNEQKNHFVGMAAHDLRSPLAIIGLSSDLLLAGDAGGLSEDQSILIGRIHALSDFMHRLVNDMLDLTQIEAGKLALNRQPTDLALLAKQNVALNALVAERKKINIELDVTGPLHARVDAVKMDQVLNNLLLNAIAFSKPGSIVKVRLQEVDGALEMSVADEGPGIPAHEVERLFTPFESTSVKSTGGEKSTGLGLAIARKIVTGHGGRIWVESALGKGSIFFLTIPLQP